MDFFPVHTVTGFAHIVYPMGTCFFPNFYPSIPPNTSPQTGHVSVDFMPHIACIQISAHTRFALCTGVHECFFLHSSQQVLDVAQTTDVIISIKRRHPIANEKKYRPSSSSSSYIFWGRKPFFFLFPKKHKNPPRQIFVSGLTLNGFYF